MRALGSPPHSGGSITLVSMTSTQQPEEGAQPWLSTERMSTILIDLPRN